MDRLFVQGEAVLKGSVKVSGAKNSALALLAASVISDEVVILENVPRIRDVYYQIKILKELGAQVEWVEDNTVRIEASPMCNERVPFELAKELRASSLLLGALLAKCGRAEIPVPGGCNIGTRPMDLHIKGIKQMGAKVELDQGYITASGKLTGSKIYLDFPSVGATENIMLAALGAEGTTIIENAAKEPEIIDLANFLNSLGAKVRGAGTDYIRINGKQQLRGVRYSCIPDRIEAGTYMIAAAVTKGCVRVNGIIPEHLHAVAAKLEEIGAGVEMGDSWIEVQGSGCRKAVDIKTMPHPGFPTDLQSPMLVLLTGIEGSSTVIENVFENRFKVASELRRMGANIKLEGRSAFVIGKTQLRGAQVKCWDLRGGAALLLAGLKAEGITELTNVKCLERGYENIVEKFVGLGAKIQKM
ncbi:UDP-N-acetylglucosamine 1-carboxyvinyltransferase [Desulfitispora alkaliphila]|uniref:UDP-N-acetylglucosamine 1-carboxyvinyltransferase n=1 Tax=Desulfitispora alkaliphila TaxID=622674 RepID=UPI003D207CF5